MQEEPQSEKDLLEAAREAAEFLTDRGRKNAPARLVSHAVSYTHLTLPTKRIV